MTKTRKILLLLIILLLMISFSLAVSYGYYQHSATNNPSQVVATIGGGDLALENETQITLTKDRSSPISDKKALSSDLYKMTFKVSNNSASEYGYDIALVPLSNTTINIASVKYAIYPTTETKPSEGDFLNEELITLSSNVQSQITDMYGESPTSGYMILENEVLLSNQNVTYNLYIWVDYYEGGVNNSQKNKTFEGVVVITDAKTYDRASFNLFLNQQKANILTLPKLSTNTANSITNLTKNQGVDINNVTKIYSVDLNKAQPDYQNINMVFFADVDNSDVISTWTEGNCFYIGERNEVRPGPSMASAFRYSYIINNLKAIKLNNFNTSKVTDMSWMFEEAGHSSTDFSIDLGNHFNTSNVTNMSNMFSGLGMNSFSLTLNLGNHFNTSNVTNMVRMFSSIGRHSKNLILNLGPHFNTSKVTDMGGMFSEFGRNSTLINLNLGSHFNTSNVIHMSSMFSQFGSNCPNISLNLGPHFNTAKTEDMFLMFFYAGYNSKNFILNLSSFYINNTSVDIFYFAPNLGATSIIFGNGWGNANTTDLDNNFMLLNKPLTVYGNSTFHSYRIGNKTMWNRWRGNGNTTFILDLP